MTPKIPGDGSHKTGIDNLHLKAQWAAHAAVVLTTAEHIYFDCNHLKDSL